MYFGPWVYIVVGGVILLGIAIAYGIIRNNGRSSEERAASERGAHQLYEREDGEP